jgi:hypothetical protein
MNLNYETVNNKIHKFLLPYFVFIFITTIIGSIYYSLEHNSWTIGDWLINYEGGFVRRGFIGEIIYIISNLTNIYPGLITTGFHTLFYGIFLYYSYKLLKLEKNLIPFLFLIFSPFIFTFQITEMLGGFRKEIIFLAIESYLIWIAKTNKEKFEYVFFIIIIFILPFAILSHELIALYEPYLFAIYFLTVKKINLKKLFLSIIPSIIAILLVITHKGNKYIVNDIFSSLNKLNYHISGGAISYLNNNTIDAFNYMLNRFSHGHYILYLVIIFLVSFAFIPIKDRLLSIKNNKFAFISVILSFIFSITLFIVAVDWGRWIYIHTVSLFLISLLIKSKKEFKVKNLKKYLYLVILYSLSWHIPHCCNAIKIFSFNIYLFLKPYIKIISLLLK